MESEEGPMDGGEASLEGPQVLGEEGQVLEEE